MNNLKKDIDSPKLIFTRYLYLKDEVKLSLLSSILQKKDDAIFWGYELYHSGYKNEFFEFIWKIYYDFFATLNPTFEFYLLKKYSEWKEQKQSIVVSSVIQNLLIRPYNTDIFMLTTVCKLFEIESVIDGKVIDGKVIDGKVIDLMNITTIFETWIEINDYRSIGQWILNDNDNSIDALTIYNICLNIFEKKGVKLTKQRLLKKFNTNLKINIPTMLLSKIMCLFSKYKNLIKGKNLYIVAEPTDIIKYDTIVVNTILHHYNILEQACTHGIDDLKHLSLFKLQRDEYIKEKYWYNWEYFASFSPIWFKRITEFGGKVDHKLQKVVFQEEPNDELLQEFYKNYGYEPDEQLTKVQEKSIMSIEKIHTWKWFYKTYKKNGLFEVYEEELDEFDVDGLEY
jgi:hypothetical protein